MYAIYVVGRFVVITKTFRNLDKQSRSPLKLAKGLISKLIEKWLFSGFCSLYPSVFFGSLKSFLGVTKPRLLSIWSKDSKLNSLARQDCAGIFSISCGKDDISKSWNSLRGQLTASCHVSSKWTKPRKHPRNNIRTSDG